MVDLKDLRIGNYIKVPNQENFSPVIALNDDKYRVDVYNTANYDVEDYYNIKFEDTVSIKNLEVNPILLTPEWLLKFGFKKREREIFFTYIKGPFEIDSDFETLTYDCKIVLFEADSFPKYVHQLQNIYYVLTGKEITTCQ